MNIYIQNLNKEKKNVILVFLAKALLFISSYASISLLLNILTKDTYGVWLTIIGTLNWILFFDFGIGNSLKNNITVYLVKRNIGKIKDLITQTYWSSIIISMILFSLGTILVFTTNLQSILNTTIDIIILNTSILVLLASFSFQIILKNIISILQSFHKIGNSELLNASSSIFILFIIFIFIPKNTSLIYLSILYGLIPVLFLLIFSLFFFLNKKTIAPEFRIKKKTFDVKFYKLGIGFFIIQLAVMILYSTDNYLIANLISPSEVPNYHVAMKYFNILSFGFGIFLAPVWPLVSQKYAEQKTTWIRKKTSNLILTYLLFLTFGLIMLFTSHFIFQIWLGNKLQIPFSLTLVLFLYTGLVMWCNLFATIMNGIGKIKLQTFTSVLSIFINIPLSILFVKFLNFGVLGVPLATCVSMTINGTLITIQYYLVINYKAIGIFNK